jgi:hypothetical protein
MADKIEKEISVRDTIPGGCNSHYSNYENLFTGECTIHYSKMRGLYSGRMQHSFCNCSLFMYIIEKKVKGPK